MTENGKALFELKGVTKDYQMGEVTVSALRGVSLSITKGEFVVILGHSGSGKSTLLNIIGGLDTATEGEVLYKGEALSSFTENQRTKFRRDNIGFIFQFYNLMPNLTAAENVELATEISTDPLSTDEALALVQLNERRTHFPSQLSGGEQQRVAIARAVAKQPEVLLCDEPTGALDISTGKVVLQVLADINEQTGATLCVITHNSTIGAMADRVVHMRDGQVVEIIENAHRMPADDLTW